MIMTTRFVRAIGLAFLAALPVSTTAQAAQPAEAAPASDAIHATFEGKHLDLSTSWGDAGACIELGDRIDCFRTERELLAAHPAAGDPAGQRPAHSSRSSSCSSSLRLYRWNGYGGGTLYLTSRNIWLNLANYGFDNDTSSYKVGACSSVFRSGSSGSGSTYPGATWAWARSSTMISGWNNVVSSVYIY
ncbi:MAG: hypothetical protein QNJ12_18205 [Ilumatobacter sp.]|uniref:hypothetical protein n=1 Tax=Ilumatobacter sp. TaxID=1967498 RepID=UPI0026300CB5|nr:hypothetical protein [Ilumatobacter sp.]MDJ0770732.1 hypothetical protein [Ilumatobacter sp.]